jgi:GDPmannose 4,6-dehydratase
LGEFEPLYLGNLDSLRDWGHARDYVEMQWKMLQEETPDDYVIATGEQHSVRQFVDLASKIVGINLEWEGSGESEVGIDTNNGKTIVRVDPAHYRPLEVDDLCGDASKAFSKIGWRPISSFESLVNEMMEYDLALAKGVSTPIRWINE